MKYSFDEITEVAKTLEEKLSTLDNPESITRDKSLRALYGKIKDLEGEDKAKFGTEVNQLKNDLAAKAADQSDSAEEGGSIDLTAPFDENMSAESPLIHTTAYDGSIHPISKEMEVVGKIFSNMGFTVEDSRQLDDDYHMFGSLNFPDDHPARDHYDTFMTAEGLIPPAHTSTMQNRIMSAGDPPIRAVIPGRVYRNEDVDATHEHTFHQVEGVYVDEGITLGDMLGTIQTFLETYFDQEIEFKTQPFYFPFVEPGLEYMIKMPESLRKGDDEDQWLEIMGCGMIHPNVLKEAGIDPNKYSGFAWGFGLDRLVLLKYGIEDVRHFHSGALDFLWSLR